MVWAALGIVLGQSIVLGVLVLFVRTFGQFTQANVRLVEAVMAEHKSNLLVYRSNLALVDELRRARAEGMVSEEVARDIAAARAAQFVHDQNRESA